MIYKSQNIVQSKADTKADEPLDNERLKDGNSAEIDHNLASVQLKKHNNTGLPDKIKSGIENLSGYSMDDVKVHYNSSKPAQLQAHAYTQGTDIHVASGQEKHLAHEAWHVVQQKQGRVKPTLQMKEISINDNTALENEADIMGAKALNGNPEPVSQLRAYNCPIGPGTIQMDIGFEFQARRWQFYRGDNEFDTGRGESVHDGQGWHLESDGGEPEFVTDHFPETEVKKIGNAAKSAAKYAASISTNKGSTVNTNYFSKNPKALSIKPQGAPAENPLTADPQINAGISFERLAATIDHLSRRDPTGASEDSEANKNLMQNKKVKHYSGDDLLLGKAVANVRKLLVSEFTTLNDASKKSDINYDPGHKNNATFTDEEREKVAGIMALLTSYLMKAIKVGHALMKDVPLLSKSNLAVAVARSPLVQPPWNAHQQLIIDIIIEASGRSKSDYVYGKDPKGDHGPKITDWLAGLFTGKDLLSKRDNSSFVDHSMGPLNKVDQVGPAANKAAPVLEFRRVNHDLPYTDWEGWAINVAKWVALMNDDTKDTKEFGKV